MAGFTIKTFDQLVIDMAAWITSHSSQITDLTPGSVLRSICEGAGLCLEELYVGTYLGFKRQMETIQQDVWNFEKKGGNKATAYVIFTRVGTTGTTTIAIGTRVGTPSGLNFVTTMVGTISPGSSVSNSVEVEAAEVGTMYNVSAVSITVMVDTVDGVVGVNNANAATGGINIESDYEYKRRFQDYIEGLGKSNIAGLVYGAKTVSGITSASVYELFPPVANVNAYLYIDDGSVGGVSPAKILEVQTVIDGDGTEDNPGYRAAGVNVVVVAPSILVQNITLTATLAVGTFVDSNQVRTDINTALSDYVNNLGIGVSIIKNELIAAIMKVYGVTDCSISVPAGNVTITAAQVGRLGVVDITLI